MEKIAVFPGSFDPFTIGHQSVVNRASPLFDRIIIAVGHNTGKKTYLKLENRLRLIRDVFINNPKIEVDHYDSLTVDYCFASWGTIPA